MPDDKLNIETCCKSKSHFVSKIIIILKYRGYLPKLVKTSLVMRMKNPKSPRRKMCWVYSCNVGL